MYKESEKSNKVESKICKVNLREDDKLEGIEAGNGFTKTMAKRRNETIDELPLEIIHGDKNTLRTSSFFTISSSLFTIAFR